MTVLHVHLRHLIRCLVVALSPGESRERIQLLSFVTAKKNAEAHDNPGVLNAVQIVSLLDITLTRMSDIAYETTMTHLNTKSVTAGACARQGNIGGLDLQLLPGRRRVYYHGPDRGRHLPPAPLGVRSTSHHITS